MKSIFLFLLFAFVVSCLGLSTLVTECPCPSCPPPKMVNVTVTKIVKVPHHVYVPVFKTVVKTVEKCPADFQQLEETCVKTVTNVTGSCPVGYYKISDTECQQVLIIKGKLEIVITHPIICPAGYTKKGKYRCVKVLKCPPGFHKNAAGECLPDKIKCPAEYVRVGRTCLKVFRCPKGFEKKGHECVPLECPTGEERVKGVCKPVCSTETPFPVCGSNGVTYKSLCEAKHLKVSVLYKGECHRRKKCPTVYHPVCGTNGITYQNACNSAKAHVKVAHVGHCPPCKPKVCPNKLEPVCGKNGITYQNQCHAEKAEAEISYVGYCKPCRDKGHKGRCPQQYEPVCGADGVTYWNSCNADKIGAKIQYTGHCKECAASYGKKHKKIAEKNLRIPRSAPQPGGERLRGFGSRLRNVDEPHRSED